MNTIFTDKDKIKIFSQIQESLTHLKSNSDEESIDLIIQQIPPQYLDQKDDLLTICTIFGYYSRNNNKNKIGNVVKLFTKIIEPMKKHLKNETSFIWNIFGSIFYLKRWMHEEGLISIEYIIQQSLFENVYYNPHEVSLMDFAIDFNSIKIVKYLFMNGALSTSQTVFNSICSRNYEIIHMIESKCEDEFRKNCLSDSIQCWNLETAMYSIENYGYSQVDQENAISLLNPEQELEDGHEKVVSYVLDVVKLKDHELFEPIIFHSEKFYSKKKIILITPKMK